jgi:hypothetical protein
MMKDECGTHGEMRIGRGNKSSQRKPAPVPFCPPQIPHDLTWDGTQAAVVGSWQLTAWAMARTQYGVSIQCFGDCLQNTGYWLQTDTADCSRRLHYELIWFEITGFLDFVHHPVLQLNPENTTFRKLDLFQSSGEGERHLLCWVPQKELTSIIFSKGPNRVGASPLTWGLTHPVFETLCSLGFLEYRTMDKAPKPSNSKC